MIGPSEVVRYWADAVIPCDGTGRVFRPGVVEVVGDTIHYVGPPAIACVAEQGACRPTDQATDPVRGSPGITSTGADVPVRDVRVQGLLLPGFVNVHCHSPMTLFRGTAENLPLHRWLREVVWPAEAHLTADDVFWGMTLASVELLQLGVTTTCEMYFFEDALADAVLAAGLRSVITPPVMARSGPDDKDGGNANWWARRLDTLSDFYTRRNNDGGRIEVGFGPHSAQTVPLPVLAELAAMTQELDAIFHMHVAEAKDETERYAAEHGRSVPEALADVGALDGKVIAAHSIWLSDADVALFRQHDVAVAHCPQSNAKLASGVAPLTRLLAAGIRVGLGTDGPASNNDLDMWEEMRLAVLLARVRDGDAAAVPAETALELATRGGGSALGRGDLGTLAPGSQADMVLVNMEDPSFVPLHHDAQLFEHVVWSASSRLVTDVWVAGRQVVADGRCLTVDVRQAYGQVQDRSSRLLTG